MKDIRFIEYNDPAWTSERAKHEFQRTRQLNELKQEFERMINSLDKRTTGTSTTVSGINTIVTRIVGAHDFRIGENVLSSGTQTIAFTTAMPDNNYVVAYCYYVLNNTFVSLIETITNQTAAGFTVEMPEAATLRYGVFKKS